ncbi:MAG: hypothetical protein HOH43_17775 [Candidatus Latescibacteria bacterium]|jgi:ureidoglycolate dehydrogenase (NAD+)|nr:hypothetical protein [Candidatus Latescibacterota bacterium]
MAYVPVNYDNDRYHAEPLRRFSTEIFQKAGLPEDQAAELANYLVATDLRGVLSHGTSGVPGYANGFRNGKLNPRPHIETDREAGATIQLNGDGCIGHLLSARAVQAAVNKAAEYGVGMAFGRYCGHTGSIGNWTRIATANGMIALFTSTAVAPADTTTTQSVTQVFRDHPFSFGFPAPEGKPPIVIDMGTLLAPIDIQKQLAEISTLPLIKGFALQAISLMLTLPLAAQAPIAADPYPSATCSLSTIVLNPSFLGSLEDYYAEGIRMTEALHRMEPLPGLDRVLMPGELEFEREQDFLENGIPLDTSHIERLTEAGRDYGVPLYWE